MTLRLKFVNQSATCTLEPDSGGQYYWTWQIRTGQLLNVLVTRGFCQAAELRKGYILKQGETRTIDDPNFIIELPEIENGEERNIRIDFHCFESDNGDETARIKKLFSSPTLEYFITLYEEREVIEDQAKKDLLDWLNTSASSVFKSLPSPLSFLSAPGNLINLFDTLSNFFTNYDDLIGSKYLELVYTKTEGKFRYRWLAPTVTSVYEEEQPETPYEFVFTRADGKEEVKTKTSVQILFPL